MIDGIIPLKDLIADIEEGRQTGIFYTVDCEFLIDTLDVLKVFADHEIPMPENCTFEDIQTYVETTYEGYKLTYAGNTYNDCYPLSNNLTERIFTGVDGIIYAVAVNLSRDALGAYSSWVLFKLESKYELYELADYAAKEIDFKYKDEFAYVEIFPFSERAMVHVPALDVWFETSSIDLDEIREQIDTELSIP